MLGLAALGALIFGPIGFFLTLGARSRLVDVEMRLLRAEARVKELEARGVAPAAGTPQTEAPSQTAAAEPEPVVEQPAEPEVVPNEAPAGWRPGQSLPGAPPVPGAANDAGKPRPPQKPKRSLEEALGTKWSVWVGGVALAFGALLLVRYSIEEGLFGPGARVMMGIAMALGLAGAGEYMRRRDRAAAANPFSIPAVLTAAGTVAAFGAIYAAHALYGFIGPAPAFLLLGATGVACMFAAALHGPALAGLGLAASLRTPLIVDSSDPNPWPVVLYVAVVAGAAYGLARVRRWLWLALAAAGGGALWGLAFLISIPGNSSAAFFSAAVVHTLVQAALALYVFCWSTQRGVADPLSQPDKLANAVPGGFGILLGLCLMGGAANGQFGALWMLGATAMMALLTASAVFITPSAPLAGIAGLLGLLALRTWPAELADVAPFWMEDGMRAWPTPVDATQFSVLALLWGLGMGGAGGSILVRACACRPAPSTPQPRR